MVALHLTWKIHVVIAHTRAVFLESPKHFTICCPKHLNHLRRLLHSIIILENMVSGCGLLLRIFQWCKEGSFTIRSETRRSYQETSENVSKLSGKKWFKNYSQELLWTSAGNYKMIRCRFCSNCGLCSLRINNRERTSQQHFSILCPSRFDLGYLKRYNMGVSTTWCCQHRRNGSEAMGRITSNCIYLE